MLNNQLNFYKASLDTSLQITLQLYFYIILSEIRRKNKIKQLYMICLKQLVRVLYIVHISITAFAPDNYAKLTAM